MRKLYVIVFVSLAAAALVGCGGGSEASESSPATNSASAVPFDQAFIDAMVPHHRSAIAMAKAANTRGLSTPELAKIADDIITSQQKEIDQMLAWREQWFGSRKLGPVLSEVLGVPEADLGMEHGGPDEILESVDPETTFAEMMLPHHEGAVAMAENAREGAQHARVKTLAENIVAAQKREIEILEKHAGGTMEH